MSLRWQKFKKTVKIQLFQFNIYLFVGSPSNHSQVCLFTRRCITIFTAHGLRRRNTKHNQQRENLLGEVGKKIGAHFQRSSPCEVHRTHLITPVIYSEPACVKYIRDSVPRVFTGTLSHRYLLPGKHPNPRVSEGKQVFHINHVVCFKSLGTARYSYQFMPGILLKFKLPDATYQSCKQAFHGIAVRASLLTFLHILIFTT